MKKASSSRRYSRTNRRGAQSRELISRLPGRPFTPAACAINASSGDTFDFDREQIDSSEKKVTDAEARAQTALTANEQLSEHELNSEQLTNMPQSTRLDSQSSKFTSIAVPTTAAGRRTSVHCTRARRSRVRLEAKLSDRSMRRSSAPQLHAAEATAGVEGAPRAPLAFSRQASQLSFAQRGSNGSVAEAVSFVNDESFKLMSDDTGEVGEQFYVKVRKLKYRGRPLRNCNES